MKISVLVFKVMVNVLMKDKEKKPKPYTAFKYSKDVSLAEEILLGNQNVFLQVMDGKPTTKKR